MHGGAGRRKVRWPTSVSHVATSNDHPWHFVPTLGRFAAEGPPHLPRRRGPCPTQYGKVLHSVPVRR